MGRHVFNMDTQRAPNFSPTLDMIHEKSEKINRKYKIFSLISMDSSQPNPFYIIKLQITTIFIQS